MVPFVVSRLLFNHGCSFPFIRKGGVSSRCFDFLSACFFSGSVCCFFAGVGEGEVYVCIFFFLRVFSICS